MEVIASGSNVKNVLGDGSLMWGYCRSNGLFVPINCDSGGNLGVSAGGAGAATEAKQDAEIAKMPAPGTALAPASGTNVITTQRPSVTEVMSTAFEASKILKNAAGQLVELSVFNSGPAQFLLLMNSATLPGDGAVSLLYPPIPIPAATLLVLDLPAPLKGSAGIVICNSSTGTFTKTIGAADCAFYAQVN